MTILRSRSLAFLLTAASLGCAETVPDVDRTQGNLLRRADLEGEWYLLQTVTKVPSTTGYLFEGETSRMERVRFRFEENTLVAYRAYALVPGASNPSAGVAFDGTENPVAAWPVLAYVDVERAYNSSTGEQSNVIEENTSDRLWFERDYVRVDWSQSQISNFDFIAPTREVTAVASFTPEEQGGAEARVSSLGINGQVGPINSPTVLNARFNFVQFWDGSAADLREQAAGPIGNPLTLPT